MTGSHHAPRGKTSLRGGEADIASVEAVLRQWIGLDAATVGPAALQRAVQVRMQAAGIKDAESYAGRVASDRAERDLLVEEVVVGESWFFRDRQVFDFVVDFALTLASLPGRAPVRILCAPCAGGEEPYSVAMALLDAGLAADRFRIDAIDVSHAALARAARGRYSANAFRNADLSFRDRWFTSTGGGAVIDDAVRSCVSFSWANVVDNSFCEGRSPYDIIFCRNLLIYLTTEARARVEAAIDRLLKPDGVLVLGAAEPPILKGDWLPAGSVSVFAMRRGLRPAAMAPAASPSAARVPHRRPPRRLPAAATQDRQATAPGPQQAPDLAEVLEVAGSLANAQRYAEAVELCEAARTRLPPSPELFFLMGMLHQSAGDLDRAEGCFHKTLYLDAAHEEALLALALLATRRGDSRMADTYRQSAARVLARKASP
jgi:chemotaxis protein methyltransferase WspC